MSLPLLLFLVVSITIIPVHTNLVNKSIPIILVSRLTLKMLISTHTILVNRLAPQIPIPMHLFLFNRLKLYTIPTPMYIYIHNKLKQTLFLTKWILIH